MATFVTSLSLFFHCPKLTVNYRERPPEEEKLKNWVREIRKFKFYFSAFENFET